MMTREELRTVRASRERLNRLRQKLQSLRCLSTSLTNVLSDCPPSKNFTSRLEETLTKIIDAEAEILAEEKYLSAARTRLLNEIMTATDDPIAQSLLILYYVEGCSFRQAARALNYSLRQTFRLHDEILKDVISCNG